MVFSAGSDYWSDNYQWFLENYSDFLYIDRIVVSENARNRGVARRLYENVFEYGRDNDFNLVCAEIDIEPEYNYPSMKFHKKMGFKEIGTRLSKKRLTVSLQVKTLK